MEISTGFLSDTDTAPWDNFVDTHAQGCLYQLQRWRRVIQASYRHAGYFIIARTQSSESTGHGRVAGILPLFQIKHWLFGNSLISIPYFDNGGVLADTPATEAALIQKSLELAKNLGATHIELRNHQPLLNHDECVLALDGQQLGHGYPSETGWNLSLHTDKVRMVLPLPGTPESLLQSFKAKLRSQIRRPEKEGLTIKQGRHELLADFYRIFATNMRDLGSPVHSKTLFTEVLNSFPDSAWLFIAYGAGVPMAGALVIGHKQILYNPWASSNRKFSYCSPNMLLYWSIIKYGYQHGYTHFDMGRCSPESSAYKFKAQWGAQPIPIHWYSLGKPVKKPVGRQPQKHQMGTAIACWKRLPVTVATLLGPPIRKYIAL